MSEEKQEKQKVENNFKEDQGKEESSDKKTPQKERMVTIEESEYLELKNEANKQKDKYVRVVRLNTFT